MINSEKNKFMKLKSKCCGSDLIKYNNKADYCTSCLSVFTKNLPSDQELIDYYKRFNEGYHGGGREKDAKKRQLKYALKYLAIVNKFSNEDKLLIDIGSSNNPFPNLAYSSGLRVTVVDYVKPKELDKSISFIPSSIENLTDIKGEFDMVTAFAIIEHTKDPFLALKNLVSLCKIGGKIVVYIPEIGEFSDNNSLGTTNWYCPPEHLNLLSKKGLIKILSKMNCNLEYYSRFELNQIRFIIRYGIGFFEGTIGFFVKKINYNYWLKIRQRRKSKYQGMGLFVFQKIS
jgi:Methyltransferase domain